MVRSVGICLTLPSSPDVLLLCIGADSRSLGLPRMMGAAIPIPAAHWRPPSNANWEWG